MSSELPSEYLLKQLSVFLTVSSLFIVILVIYLQPNFFDVSGVVNIGKGASGVIKLVVRAIETKQAALLVGFPLVTEYVPASILIDGGEYASDNFSGMMIGPGATVTMCGGEVQGGNAGNDSGPGYTGVGLIWGGEFHMAGGHIVGADTNEGVEHFGYGLTLLPDADTFPTATITGGTITGGSYLGVDGNYYIISVYAGNMTTVHLAGGNLSGDLYVEPKATVVVYGETYLSYKNEILTGKLCDGSELGGLTVYGGGNVELMDCSNAPKIEECGKKGKTGKGDAPHQVRQKTSKAK